MPLAWTLHHPINPDSPLFDLDFKKCCAAHGELLVMIQGVDEGSGQVIFARTSYTSEEIGFGACFEDMFKRDPSGRVMSVDMERFDKVQKQVL